MPFSDDMSESVIKDLRVAGSTPPKDLAGSIIHLLQEGQRVRLAAIGHQAVGQAIKAIPIVNQYCISQGYIVTALPSYALMSVQARDAPPVPIDAGVGDESSRTNDRTVTMLMLIRVSPQ